MTAFSLRYTTQVLVILVVVGQSGVASAGDVSPPQSAATTQVTASDKALAEGLFQDAKKLMSEGRLDEACPKFAESQRIDPSIGTLLNLAVCHEKQGRTASAWAEFKEVGGLAKSAGATDRAEFAKKMADELEGRLSRISLEVKAPVPEMKIKLNKNEISVAAATGSGIPVDPGSTTIEVTAPGKQPWSQQITVAPGPSTQQVIIPPLEDAPKTGPDNPPPVETPQDGSTARTIGFILGGVGIVGVGVGSVFGIMTFSKASDASDQDMAFPDRQAAYQDGKTTGMVSNIAFGVGVASLAAGVILVLTSGSSQKAEPRQGVWVSPEVSAAKAQMTVGGSW